MPTTVAVQAAEHINEGKEEEAHVWLSALLDEARCSFASVLQVAVAI